MKPLVLGIALLLPQEAPSPQEPPPAPEPAAPELPEAEGEAEEGGSEAWQTLDLVVAIVDDEIITLSDVVADIARMRDRFTITTQAEYLQAIEQAIDFEIGQHLASQAGAELGLDEEIARSRIEGYLENQREGTGALQYAEALESQGLSAQEERSQVNSQFYQAIWRQKVRGLSGPTRPTWDGYVRPSLLHAIYAEEGDPYRAPPTIELRELWIDADAVGGPEAARALAADLRERLVAGEDFGALVEEFGSAYRDSDGMARPRSLAEVREPGLREWLETAREGDLSPILGLPGRESGARIVRLRRREESAPPRPFLNRSLQEDYLSDLRAAMEQQRLIESEVDLRRNAYVRVLWRP